jgi:hypothetical protein
MASIFAVNAKNDIFIGPNRQLVINRTLQAVLQTCEHAIKAQLGEMIYSITRGMPNFQVLWVGNPNFAQYEAALQKAIRAVAGVNSVLDLEISVENNVFSYTAVIETIYGQGVINGDL